MIGERDSNLIQANMYKVILTISIPLMVNSLMATIYNLVDAFWVGKLGAAEFASTTFVAPILGVFIALGIGVSSAGTSVISQMIGRGRQKDAANYAYQLLILGLGLGFLLFGLSYLLAPLAIDLMGANPEIRGHSIDYLKVLTIGFPPVLMVNVINSLMQSQGKTRPLMLASVAAGLMNMVLDPVFIFKTIPWVNLPGLGLGVAGAALATVLSQLFNVLVGVAILRKHSALDISPRSNSFDFKKSMDLVRIGVPAIVGHSSASFGFIILNVFITAYGTATLAAYGVVNRVTDLIIQLAMGIGAGIPAIVGQNIGAGRMDRVKDCFRKSQLISFCFSALGGVLVFIFAQQVVLFFINAKEAHLIMPEAMEYMKYTVFIIPLMGAFSIFQGFYLGTGHTEIGMRMSFGRLWAIRLPMIWLFQKFTSLGSTGIWIAMLASNFLIIVYASLVYKQGRWQRKRLG